MSGNRRPCDAAAFYCMSSDVYFLGAVGMINSLRLQGHDEPIYLLDLGLERWQRELLTPEVTLVSAPASREPWLMKTVAPLAHPAEVMVLIDADMIVTRPLTELIASAEGGRVIAFENQIDRFVPEWGELLELGPVRRRPYVSSGLVVLGGKTGAEVVRLLDDRQRRVDFERSHFGADEPDYELRFLDQDVLNAILAARVEPERVGALPFRLAPVPPFEGLGVDDAQGLRCAYDDGVEPYVVHHFGVKPWLEPTHDGIYSQLLRRLLVAGDVAIRVPEEALPLRFQTGPLAYAERKRINARQRLRWRLRGRTA
jgi:hypothetical protein